MLFRHSLSRILRTEKLASTQASKGSLAVLWLRARLTGLGLTAVLEAFRLPIFACGGEVGHLGF